MKSASTFVIYGVSDCPACLMVCAAAMDYYPKCEYVFVNMDFGESYRSEIKQKYDHHTYPIIIFAENGCETLVGGYDELVSFIANHKEYGANSTPVIDKKREPV